MIDRELRKQLSQDLRRLVTGRITNDEFDDAYFERYVTSTDATVLCVAEFGYGLYGDLFPYRLKDRYALDRATRRTAARCVLFLRMDLEYEWPNQPNSVGAMTLYALASMGIPVGIALLICSLPMLIGGVRDVEFLWSVAAFGVVILIASVWYRVGRGGFAAEYYSTKWLAWRNSGDFDVWPFFRREDFYQARRTAHLLAAS